ncbi:MULTISPECIES: AAA family ATPase [unclassified Streptomyces]|uniref:AAA family ATPase n=1 Tax=unclassified Streptomyces TaxID=2593676 RepID=UPI00225BFB74|nr:MULTISPECIES: AAA family ATPase [unclassified Streptomyces]MCX5049708.1 AAA family ATPase [Streptomyces sp. NBC_00474]
MTQTAEPVTVSPTGTEEHLWLRLRAVEERVRHAVALRRAGDPDPDDPYRGQYLTPEAAARILHEPGGLGVPEQQPWQPPAGSVLGALATRFALSSLDLDLLLVATAPDLDARFERLYGYLNDDLTRRRPTVGLALELCGLAGAASGRFRLAPSAPLVAGGLVEVTEAERPPLSRVLTVPDRVTGHLLGSTQPDARLAGVLGEAREDPTAETAEVHRAAAAAGTGAGLVQLRSRGGDAGGLAVAALHAAGMRALVLDAAALARRPDDVPAIARVVALEARLTGAGVVLGPLEALPAEPAERARTLGALCTTLRGIPLLTHGTVGWDPLWAADTPVVLTVPAPSPERQAARWRHALNRAAGAGAAGADDDARTAHDADGTRAGVGVAGSVAGDVEALARAVAAHRLDSGQLHRAADVAVRTAALAGRPVRADDLRSAVRAQNGAGLERLARRVEPGVGWDDLVLPPPTHRRLRELALRARHREQVLGQWGMRPGGGRGRGVIALFAGESGTGKTMSAEVVAADLGMDLYVVDLSTVVDKYVGETEKNLERIFTEASAVNAVLLFDEADAIFGKRSEVKDAHDRHANIESAYLLQRMESFDGIAVLTTNLRANLDEAFTRRLDVVADFPVPDAGQRLALWERCLGERLPRDADLDLAFCADRFELAGGSIRACAVTAAYLAAESGAPLAMRQLVTAIAQEYRKLGRLVLEGEFGPYLAEATGA